jgi:glucose/arabinose dehydrogenase
VALLSIGLLLASCAELPDTHSGQWREKPEFNPAAPPDPGDPQSETRVEPPPTSVPPPDGCRDFNPSVIATCLTVVTTIMPLEQEGVALAAERGGRVLRVEKNRDPVLVATVPVDVAAGGLTGLAPSPSYREDGLLYAYITTATESQVVRIAPGDAPKPIGTGIPRLPGGDNRGAITLDRAQNALLVATSGTPVSTADPNSLAGKVLRIDTTGGAAEGNPGPSRVVTSGVNSPGGLCVTPENGAVWLTDSTADRDLLYRVEPGKPLPVPTWSWPDKPVAGGCSAWPDMVIVAAREGRALINVALNGDSTPDGPPELSEQKYWGQIATTARAGANSLFLGTMNRIAGGTPVSSDDRVAIFARRGGSDAKD